MGFLKDMLNPKKAFKETLDPRTHIKNTVNAFQSGDIKQMLDPAGMYGKIGPGGKFGFGDYTSSPKNDPTDGIGDGYDPAAFAGDPNDPAFGSLTDPFTVENFYEYADPGYAFRLQQGNQALQNSAAAGSGAMSGAALKDLLRYNQEFASTEYGNAFNRYQTQQGNIFGRLFDLARLGQSAASGVGTTGASLAGNAGQFLSNAGSAYGGGIVGAGNAASQGLTDYWLMQRYAPRPVAAGTPGSV